MKRSMHLNNLEKALADHSHVLDNPDRERLIQDALDNREAVVSANGALATWTPPESTGRSPRDTYLVRHPESEENIDWDSPNNIPMSPETFDMLFEDALKVFPDKPTLYVTDRVVSADTS